MVISIDAASGVQRFGKRRQPLTECEAFLLRWSENRWNCKRYAGEDIPPLQH
jgi:hypothetical protein